MAFSTSNNGSRLASMNITPLVDVMLVLLIIFMVAMPKISFPIGVDLPQAGPTQPRPPKDPPINLKIDASNQLSWNGSAIPISALDGMMKEEAARYATTADQPVIQIDTDKDARYDTLAQVLAKARNAGLVKIGFVDDHQR